MDKKDYKYILRRVITYFIIFFLLLFFKSCKANAQTIVTEYGVAHPLYVTIGGESWTGDNWFTIQANSNRKVKVTLEWFNEQSDVEGEGLGNPVSTPTYVLATVCVASGYTGAWYLDTHTNDDTNGWFDESTFIGWSAELGQDSEVYCTTPDGKTGRRGMIQWRVTWSIAPPDIDGSKSNYVAQGYLNMNNTINYTVYAHFYTWMISDTDLLSTLRSNKWLMTYIYQQNGKIDTINSNLSTIISIIQTTQSQNTAINNSIQSQTQQQHQDAQQSHTDSQNTQNAINNSTNQAHQDSQEMKNTITDTSSPTNLNGLSQSAGWLPPGPVDSILNLPLSLLNNISDNLSKSCQPVILTIPYVNSTLTLPCLNTLYSQMGVGNLLNFIGAIASCFILLSYLLKLYRWVDDTLTFRENNYIDNWGGI